MLGRYPPIVPSGSRPAKQHTQRGCPSEAIRVQFSFLFQAVISAERCPSGLRSTPGKCVYGLTPYRGFESLSLRHYRVKPRQIHAIPFYGGPCRPLATIGRKPRQGRKAATVLTDSGAEASRQGLPP